MNEEIKDLISMTDVLNELFKDKSIQKCYAVILAALETLIESEGVSEEDASKFMNEIQLIYFKYTRDLKK